MTNVSDWSFSRLAAQIACIVACTSAGAGMMGCKVARVDKVELVHAADLVMQARGTGTSSTGQGRSIGFADTNRSVKHVPSKQEQFFSIVRFGDATEIKRLIASGSVDVNKGDPRAPNERPINFAAGSGRLENVKILVDAGARVRMGNAADVGANIIPVYYAVARLSDLYNYQLPIDLEKRRIEVKEIVAVIDYLLGLGADPRMPVSDRAAAFVSVMRAEPFEGQVELLKRLVAHGVVPSDLGESQYRPLNGPAALGNLPAIEYVLSVWSPSKEALQFAMFAAVESGMPEVVQRFIKAGANPRTPVESRTLLNIVMLQRRTNIPMLEMLMREGIDVNGLDSGNPPQPATNQATRWHDHERLEFLLSHGAKPDRSDLATAIHIPPPEWNISLATQLGTIRLLFKYKADPGTSVMAARPGDHEIIDLLLEKGAKIVPESDPMVQRLGQEGGIDVGPVTWSLLRGNEYLASRMMARGALSQSDCGAIYYAAALGQVESLEQLLKFNPRWEAVRNDENETALFAAAENGKLETVRMLLATRRQDINWQTPIRPVFVPATGHPPGFPSMALAGGLTLLMAAARSGNMELVKYLLASGANPKLVASGGGHHSGGAAWNFADRWQKKEIAKLLRDRYDAP